MQRAFDFPRKFPAGVVCAVLFAAACAEPSPTATVDPVEVGTPRASVTPTLTDIVVSGGGAFNTPITVNTSGWTTTEFWDNPSDDTGDCNVGFYAVGTISAGCANEQAGSYANRGGYGGGSYWGIPMGGAHVNPAAFMFSGSYPYLVTLKGSYAGATSEVGWFTKDAGGYHRHLVAGWGAKTVGAAVLVPRGATWGLYIKRGGEHPTEYDYTDATGDLHNPGTDPVQQFALFAKGDASAFLVGIEDNPEETVGVGDDDFNDYLLSVEPLGGLFVIGDVEAHALTDVVNFWGAQWWKNNAMSGEVSSGVAAFKGYASEAGIDCGGVWSSAPGNSANPPAMIPARVLVIVTNTVLKSGSTISGTIRQLLIVDHDGGYAPNPGHAGAGPVTQLVCSASGG